MGRQRLPAFDAGESPYYLRRYESTYVLSFLCGAAVMLGLSTLSGSNAESPTPRLRTAPLSCQRGQNECSKRSLWQLHRRDLQAAQHEEHRLLVARRCAEFSEPVYLHSGASQPSRGGEELGRFPSRSGMAED